MKFSQPVLMAGSVLCCVISAALWVSPTGFQGSAISAPTGQGSGSNGLISSAPETPPAGLAAPEPIQNVQEKIPAPAVAIPANSAPTLSRPAVPLTSSPNDFTRENQTVFYRGQNLGRGSERPRVPVGQNPPPFPSADGRGNSSFAPRGNDGPQNFPRNNFPRPETPDFLSPRRPDTLPRPRGGQAEYYNPDTDRGESRRGRDPFLPPYEDNRDTKGLGNSAVGDRSQNRSDAPVTPSVSAYNNQDTLGFGENLQSPTSRLPDQTGPGQLPRLPGSQPVVPQSSGAQGTVSVPVTPESLRGSPLLTQPRVAPGLFSGGDLFRAEPFLGPWNRADSVVIGPSIGVSAVPFTTPRTANCGCGQATCKTCRVTCQPLCLTKTIWVPQWYTVFSTVNETHYRPRVKEEPYFIEQKVTHQVPVIETFPVIVKEPRIRNFKKYRQEEYQVPREVEYTVMVPTPKTRQVTSERQESYQVPEEEQYTVMVPKEREVRKTKYKIVKDREPVHKEYVVMVPQQRKRIKIEYETRKRTIVRKVPYTTTEERELTRKVVKYRSVVEKVMVTEPYVDYVSEDRVREVPKLEVIKGDIASEEEFLDFQDREQVLKEKIPVQVREKRTIQETYTVSVPYKEEIEEVYWENEPYEETVSRDYEVKTIVGRDVTKPYVVKLPYTEHVPQTYTIRIPYEAQETRYREIPKQTPVTKYQKVKRDLGRWVTESVSLETYEEGQDLCGCPTCCPKARTIRRTRWVPNVVTQKLPYTDFKTVKQIVPYQVPVIKYRQEQRQRMIEMTKYRTEVRQATEKVYSFETATKQRAYPVRKFRLVRKTRAKTVTNYREEKRTKNVPVNTYITQEEERLIPFETREVIAKRRPIRLPHIEVADVVVREPYSVNRPVIKTRQVEKLVTVRVPYDVTETYTVKVPVINYRDVNETEEYEVEVPREVSYTVNAPEIRTKTEYVDVERKVPYVETTMVTEMVPEIRTRRVYKTRTRTVSDIKQETFMTAEPEIQTKTVYDKLMRDVPVFYSELYWENVTKVLKKTVFKPVTRTIKRPSIRRYKVLEPYNVKVKVPQRVSRLVPKKITIPVQSCCEQCCTEFTELTDACGAYITYGLHQARRWINDPWQYFSY